MLSIGAQSSHVVVSHIQLIELSRRPPVLLFRVNRIRVSLMEDKQGKTKQKLAVCSFYFELVSVESARSACRQI